MVAATVQTICVHNHFMTRICEFTSINLILFLQPSLNINYTNFGIYFQALKSNKQMFSKFLTNSFWPTFKIVPCFRYDSRAADNTAANYAC